MSEPMGRRSALAILIAMTLATVAEQSGFADAAHLSRVVREVTGDTPRTVRLRAQQSAGRGRLVLESRNGDTTPVA